MSDANPTPPDSHDASPLLAARARPALPSPPKDSPAASPPANTLRPARRGGVWVRWLLALAALAAVGFFAANVAAIRGDTEAGTPAEHSALLKALSTSPSTAIRSGSNANSKPTPPFRTPNMAPATPMDDDTRRQCFATRDYGMIPGIREVAADFCTRALPGGDADLGGEATSPSKYTYFKFQPGNLVATVMANVTLDFRHVKVAADIPDVSKDGYYHDPRFDYKSVNASCSCLQPQTDAAGAPRVWDRVFAGYPSDNYSVCEPVGASTSFTDVLKLPAAKGAVHAVALARKDDHNPFFQISAALNAWVFMQALNWSERDTQLVWLDKGFPTPVDALQHAVLAPTHAVVAGADLMGRVVRFDSVLVAPYEMSGPMMFHLDNGEPCHNNSLMSDFRSTAIDALQVYPAAKREAKACLVTVITRKPYGGRSLARMWLNEDEILAAMRTDYADAYTKGECTFQSVDFVALTIQEQIRVVLDSDVVIGMHGAGMVNVLWARPGTVVVEIFPGPKHRWGYRNMCQNVGCRWFDFRGGTDVNGTDMNKIMDYDEWKAFFDPLFRHVVTQLEAS